GNPWRSSIPRCLHASLTAGPVGLAQEALDELAGGVARERFVEGHLARRLVVGEVRAAELQQLARRDAAAGAELDGGVDALSPVRIGYSEDGGVLDGGMTVQGVLDRGRTSRACAARPRDAARCSPRARSSRRTRRARARTSPAPAPSRAWGTARRR